VAAAFYTTTSEPAPPNSERQVSYILAV